MRNKVQAALLALAALLLLPGVAAAQVASSGTIEVIVEDPDGSRVPGATVTASAPDAVTSRTVVTDEQGMAKLEAMLPSAQYTVTTEIPGFQGQKHENILVRSGQTTTIHVALAVSGVTEALTVQGSSPLVDTRSATSGADITLQLTESLPTGRSYQSYLQLVPGVLPDNPSVSTGNPAARSGVNYADIDGQLGVSSDNAYYFDGIDVTDPVTGTFGANLNTEIIQEQKVITGGIPAEFTGTPGLISNVITKSGSNTWHGSANYFFQNSNLVAENQHGASDEFSTKDNGYTIGGPAMRDRLWFFASYRYTNRTDDVSALDTSQFLRTVKNTQKQGFAKGTWAPSNSDLVSFTYLSDPTDISGRRERDILNTRDRSREQGGHRYSGLYNKVWGSALIELGFNKHNGEVSDFTTIAQSSNDVIFRSTDVRTLADEQKGGWGQEVIDQRDTKQFRGSLQYAWGRHTFKGGGEWTEHNNFTNQLLVDNTQYFSLQPDLLGTTAAGIASGSFSQRNFIVTNTSDYNGLLATINARPDAAAFYAALDTDSDGTISAAEIGDAVVFNSTVGNPGGFVNYSRRFQSTDGPQEVFSRGVTLFVQDEFQMNRFTFNVGIRAERWQHYASTGQKFFTFPFEIAPRLSAVFDVLGDGRQKLSAYYGRYFDPARNNLTNFVGSLTGRVLEEQVFVNNEWLTYRTRGGPKQADAFFAPSTQTPYTDDVQVGYEVDLGHNQSFDVLYINRRTRDILEDYDHNLYGTSQYPGPRDDPNSLFLDPQGYFGYTNGFPSANFIIATLAGGKRNWQGVEMVYRKRFQNNWQALVSYNYADAEGNTNSDSNADFQGDVIYLDPRAPNQFGTQPGLIRHLFKGGGSYSWPWGLQFGATFNWNSGTVASKTELQSRRNLPIQVAPEDAFAFAGITERWIAPGSVGGLTNPSWGTIDTRVQYLRDLGAVDAEFFVDIFNLFNNQGSIRDQDLVAGRGSLAFGDPIQWVTARRAFLGARLKF